MSDTLYIGKNIIELDVVDSTNNYASKLISDKNVHEGTVVLAHFQGEGKGQRSKVWVSEPGKNLTFSLVLKPKFLGIDNAFMLSKIISLAIYKYFENLLNVPVFIKWPNDIYVEDKKVCGILIENQFRGNQFEYAVVGIGINVNQLYFENLLHASSLKLLLKEEFDLKMVLSTVLKNIEIEYLRLQKKQENNLNKEYLEKLLFLGETRVYKTLTGDVTGEIKNVLSNGRLELETVEGVLKNFDIKEIDFLL